MKKLILFLMLFHSFLLTVSSQSESDCQWLVVNNIGKVGASIVNEKFVNDYPVQNTLEHTVFGSKFQMQNVTLPRRLTDRRAKNDILAIYNDWNHFNSREVNVNGNYARELDVFYPYLNNNYLGAVNHNFTTINTTPLSYLYLSDIYEDHDLPPEVRVLGRNSTSNSTTFRFGITHPDHSITANHDVVGGQDITLIIDRKSIQNGDVLQCNIARLIGTTTEFSDEYFTPSPVFNTPTKFCNVGAEYQNGRITFLGLDNLTPDTPPYVYVNLRGTDKLPLYFPDEPEKNSETVFRIQSLTKLHELHESILASHDPNLVKVLSICKTAEKQFVKYRIQFVNTGAVAADNLKVEVKFREGFNRDCIGELYFSAGGNGVPGSLDPPPSQTDKVFFDFEDLVQVGMYNPSEPEKSIGFVEFAIAVDNSMNLKDMRTKLDFNKVVVHFDTQRYQVMKFIDLVSKKKGRLRYLIKNCMWNCDSPSDLL
ncbi:MAG: hypothetical protein H7X99_06205, partial [Saprospiraceae bacterium]|nr:hypothetical protein [Saprospiraceae bacterium]